MHTRVTKVHCRVNVPQKYVIVRCDKEMFDQTFTSVIVRSNYTMVLILEGKTNTKKIFVNGVQGSFVTDFV